VSEKENKALVAQWREALNRHDVEAAARLVTPDFVSHASPLPGSLRALSAALSDIRIVVADEIAEGDRVSCRWILRGRHTHHVLGVPPTGQLVTWTGMNIFRIAGGRIAEEWVLEDTLSLLRQLGVAWRVRKPDSSVGITLGGQGTGITGDHERGPFADVGNAVRDPLQIVR